VDPEAPEVRLGRLVDGGVAPAIMAIVDRGVRRRPALTTDLRAEIELDMGKRYPPVRIVFGQDVVLVEDAAAEQPDLRVSGALPDLVSLMVAPLFGGLPNPIDRRGRAVLGMVALRRVRVRGRIALLRRFLGVIRV
jgi:hypothetical protein